MSAPAFFLPFVLVTVLRASACLTLPPGAPTRCPAPPLLGWVVREKRPSWTRRPAGQEEGRGSWDQLS